MSQWVMWPIQLYNGVEYQNNTAFLKYSVQTIMEKNILHADIINLIAIN